MSANDPQFQVSLAQGCADIQEAQRLRYAVFVQELGADGAGVDHDRLIETDQYDAHATHLLLKDTARAAGDQVVGVYRLMTSAQATAAGGFYCASEFDLTALQSSGRQLLELGRSCLHADYRGGTAMLHLWAGLSDFVVDTGAEVLFGVASFHGTDIDTLAEPLSYLAAKHAAEQPLTAIAKGDGATAMNILSPDAIDRKAAMRAIPALIKAYLRLGGVVGQGAFVDHGFNTTDVCLILDTAQMNARAAALYGAGGAV